MNNESLQNTIRNVLTEALNTKPYKVDYDWEGAYAYVADVQVEKDSTEPNIIIKLLENDMDHVNLRPLIDETKEPDLIRIAKSNQHATEVLFARKGKQHSYDLVGSGKSAIKTISAIVYVVKEMIKQEGTDVVYFSAKGGSRIKLYSKLAKIASKELPYKYTEIYSKEDKEQYYFFWNRYK